MSSRESSLSFSQSLTPVLSGHIPKYGTRIPNRIFVGGISGETTEMELRQFFSVYGPVKDCKIILDRGGVSKSYGFVTFESEEDAERILRKESENLIFKDRKLNIGQAVRKQQPFPKTYDPSVSPGASSLPAYPAVSGLQYHATPNGSNPGYTLYYTPDGYLLPAAAAGTQSQGVTYPMMVAPQTYNTQLGSSYYHQSPTFGTPVNWTTGQWRWGVQGSSSTPLVSASPYLYPVHAAMLPQETVYATHMAAPLPDLSNGGSSLVDPISAEVMQYYPGASQYPNATLR